MAKYPPEGPPAGGGGGHPFDDLMDLPLNDATMTIVAIIIRSGKFIDAIEPVYRDRNGQSTIPKHGGDGGNETRIGLQAGEFFTRITGRYGQFVDSLTLETNLGNTLAFGGQGGPNSYTFPPPGPGHEEIVAFFGASGQYVDSIGVYTRPH